MKKVYFIVMDTTKDRKDPLQMYFLTERSLNDISGYLVRIAEKHATPIDDLRLFIAPDKKTWDLMYNEFCARVDFSRWGGERVVFA